MSGGFFNPENVGQAVDLMGFNYYPGDTIAITPPIPTSRSEQRRHQRL
jgi:hypothetical protein